MKDGVYVINLDDEKSKGSQWVSLFTIINLAVYFDSFGIEYISPEVLNKIKDKYLEYKIMFYYVWIFLHCFHRIHACR